MTIQSTSKFSTEVSNRHNSVRKAPRILAGARRGLALQTPTGVTTRPIATRARKSLFDKIQHGKDFQAAVGKHQQDELFLLDVFAGSGALGIEALSRWRGHADFFENDRATALILEKNLLASQLRGRIYRHDALAPPAPPTPTTPPACAQNDFQRIALAFFSPPYDMKLAARAPEAFADRGWFRREALIVFQQAPIGQKGSSEKRTKAEIKLWAMEKHPQLGAAFTLEDCLPCSSACFFFFRYHP